MMQNQEVAERYAKALFFIADEENRQEEIIGELRSIREAFGESKDVRNFITSPLVQAAERESVIREVMEKVKVSETTANFMSLLAKKNRLNLFSSIVQAYQDHTDEKNEVIRGSVRSASVLSPEERKKVEEIVSQVTEKRVILNYSEDENLIGGLIAEVGSYTFDDTIASHLRRLKEDLKRRAH